MLNAEMVSPERIKTRQETIGACFEAFKEAIKNLEQAETEYRRADDSLTESYLQDTEHSINKIRTLL